MVLNNTCNPFRPPLNFVLYFFFYFNTAVILWFMHCNKTNIKPVSNRRHRKYLRWFTLACWQALHFERFSERSERDARERAREGCHFLQLARRLRSRQKHSNRVKRPFAGFHSLGTKSAYWDANVALGRDKQRKLPRLCMPFVGLTPMRLLRPNMLVLYHVDGNLQRANCDQMLLLQLLFFLFPLVPKRDWWK